jgi:hypothetical protein
MSRIDASPSLKSGHGEAHGEGWSLSIGASAAFALS